MTPKQHETDRDEVVLRVASALAALSLEEKVEMLAGRGFIQAIVEDGGRYGARAYLVGGGNERLGLPGLYFADGPRGICLGASTCFPVAMARGATFDAELEERIGEAMARELRAQGGNLLGAPCLNLLRHPAWGRAQETYGEDPHHLGEMAAALVRGVQKHGVIACAKHFAANSIENSRFKVDVQMDERALREVYLPHFRRCVDAGVGSVMSAYNQVNGASCGHNRPLLREILKDEWGFDGFVISDFVRGVHGPDAVSAGLDLEAPEAIHFGPKLLEAVRTGDVAERDVDDALRRVLTTVLRLAPDTERGAAELIACDAHRRLAREAAERSAVLLENRGELLPLDARKLRSLAVIGSLADTVNLGDHGSSRVRPPEVVTVLEGLRRYLGDRVTIRYASGESRDEAVATARACDAVLVVVGYTHRDEGEFMPADMVMEGADHRAGEGTIGGDRDDLALSRAHEDLLLAVVAANPRCCAAVIAGSAVTMERWREKLPAILLTWYAGMEGGSALARLLFGEISPSGRLPFSIPRSAEDLPFFDKNADAIEYDLWHGYSRLDRDGSEPAYAFGYGLSYTRFSYAEPRVVVEGEGICVETVVTNSGKRAADEVVQLYVGVEHSKVERPRKLLKAFARVALEPGEARPVMLRVEREALATYDPLLRRWVVEDAEHVAYVGGSSRDIDLKSSRFRP